MRDMLPMGHFMWGEDVQQMGLLPKGRSQRKREPDIQWAVN